MSRYNCQGNLGMLSISYCAIYFHFLDQIQGINILGRFSSSSLHKPFGFTFTIFIKTICLNQINFAVTESSQLAVSWQKLECGEQTFGITRAALFGRRILPSNQPPPPPPPQKNLFYKILGNILNYPNVLPKRTYSNDSVKQIPGPLI